VVGFTDKSDELWFNDSYFDKKNPKFEKPKPARWPFGLIFWLMKIGTRGTTPHRLRRFKEGSATT
jgi:hypothetical protein